MRSGQNKFVQLWEQEENEKKKQNLYLVAKIKTQTMMQTRKIMMKIYWAQKKNVKDKLMNNKRIQTEEKKIQSNLANFFGFLQQQKQNKKRGIFLIYSTLTHTQTQL